MKKDEEQTSLVDDNDFRKFEIKCYARTRDMTRQHYVLWITQTGSKTNERLIKYLGR